MIVSRTTNNMFRCEDVVYHLKSGDMVPQVYEDLDINVKSLGLINSDYIANEQLREKTERLKSSTMSFLT